MVKKQTRKPKSVKLADDTASIDDLNAAPVPINRKPIGSPGTQSYAGFAAEEYLSALRGMKRADVFDQMRRSDPQIKMCLQAVKNPIKGAIYEVEAGKIDGVETDETKSDAEFIQHVLFSDLDQPFKKFLSEALGFVDFGHSAFEVTHKVVSNHPKFGTYNGIRSLAWRSQRTILRWNLDPETGKLASITQQANGDLQRNVDIPADFLLVFSLDKEGSNYEGVSLLRPCYGPWFRKNHYMKLNAVGIEKFAVPTPIVTIPATKQNTEQYTKLIEVLEAFTQYQSNYITVPEGWTIDLTTNTYDPQKVELSIDNEDKRMAKAFLANFLELGMNGTGAYSLSNDLSDFMLAGLDFLAEEFTDQINMVLIPHLIKINRGPREVYPQLKHSGISDKAGKELADMLKSLGDGKFITPDDPTEAHLRKRIGLPKYTGEGKREVTPPPAAAPANALAEQIRLAEITRLRKKLGE